MWIKSIAICLSVLALIIAIVLNNVVMRRNIFFFVIKKALNLMNGKVAKYREIKWQQGPNEKISDKDNNSPNIILILADDLGFNDVSSYGDEGVAGTDLKTPHIDSIGKDGVKFMNGYTTSSTCAPSRAGLMSGRYPSRTGYEYTPMPGFMTPLFTTVANYFWPRGEAYYNVVPPSPNCDQSDPKCPRDKPWYELGLSTDEITIATQLKKKGYYTAHIGKWHLGRDDKFQPNAHGFDDSLLLYSGLYLPEDHPDVVNGHRDIDSLETILRAVSQHAAKFNKGEVFQPGGYITDYYTDEAVKMIEGNKNRPFFLYMAHWALHSPLQALRSDYDSLAHIDDHNLRVYASMIKSLDRSVGRILSAVEENGLTDNTIVIFSSDNGGAANVGVKGSNKPFRGHKSTFFEGGTHVPFMMKWPKHIPPATVYEPAVSHVDLFPTLSAAAGIALPDDRVMDGVNILPNILGRKRGNPHESIYWRAGDACHAILHKGWKMQKYSDPDRVFLYHLAEDPTEQNNLSDVRPDKVAELELEFAKHNATQVAPDWPVSGKFPVPLDYITDEEYSIEDVVYQPF